MGDRLDQLTEFEWGPQPRKAKAMVDRSKPNIIFRATPEEARQAVMTPYMLRALRFLDDKMGATSRSIGRAVLATMYDSRLELAATGAAICGHLRQRGYVTFLSDGREWRITEAGRKALASER